MLDKNVCMKCWETIEAGKPLESHVIGFLNRDEEWFCPHKYKQKKLDKSRHLVLRTRLVCDIKEFCPYWKEHRDYEVMRTLERDR